MPEKENSIQSVKTTIESTDRLNLLGTPIALVDYDRTMDVMDSMIERREPGYVVASAVHALMVAREDGEMRAALDGATLVVPDGMPIVWAARRLGTGLKDRVYGPELMARFCERSAQKGHRVFLYGGHSQDALETLSNELRKRFPQLNICGNYWAPHRPLTQEEEDHVVQELNAAKPDIIWVGTGAPRQERWMQHMRPKLDAPVLVGVGAAFDFHSGRIKQAPSWMQKRGLEWLYRLSREPKRLFWRYLTYNIRFIFAFLRQYARQKLGRSDKL